MNDTSLPESIGRYAIRGLLGRGASSTVYRAFDPFRQYEVALKVVETPEGVLADDNSQLLIESSLVGKLDHPHIAKIFEVTFGHPQSVVSMEFITGGTLERHCQPGELLDFEDVLNVAFKCGKALEFVSGIGLVHRDIKPANILLGEATDVKIADFGAAAAAWLAHSDESMAGSPYYMAPEQIAGRTVDARTDIYSLGVVLYELLTGQKPIEAGSMESLRHQILHTEPAPPSRIRPALPKITDAIIARCLRKDPSERYPGWADFLADIVEAGKSRGGAQERASLATEGERFEALRECAFFEGFDDVQLWQVLEFARFDRVVPGDVIMREGDLGDFFAIVLAGEVGIMRKGRLIETVPSGESIGEIAYATDSAMARSATCVALGDGVLVRIPNAALAAAPLASRSAFERKFLRLLAQRLVGMNARIAGQ